MSAPAYSELRQRYEKSRSFATRGWRRYEKAGPSRRAGGVRWRCAMRTSVRVAQDDMRGFLLRERKKWVAKNTVRFAMRLVRGAMCVLRVPVSLLRSPMSAH